MSYIRCTSNNEGLYVFKSKIGLEFWWIDDNNLQLQSTCNPKDFRALCRKLSYDWHYVENVWIKSGSVSVRETWLDHNNKPINSKKAMKNMLKPNTKPYSYTVQLKIKNKILNLQGVTLQYLMNNFCIQEEKENSKWRKALC